MNCPRCGCQAYETGEKERPMKCAGCGRIFAWPETLYLTARTLREDITRKTVLKNVER